MKKAKIPLIYHVSSIEFYKDEEPDIGTDIDSNMTYDYSFDEDSNRIIITTYFGFNPKSLFHGKIEFIATTREEGISLEKEKVTEITEGFLPHIATEVSFLAAICGDAMYGAKIIAPPYFDNKEGE